MGDRERFENHMRKLNPCVRLARQTTDGTYRTTSVERAWHLWQEAMRQGREQVAAEAQAWVAEAGSLTGAKYVGGGTVELTFTKEAKHG